MLLLSLIWLSSCCFSIVSEENQDEGHVLLLVFIGIAIVSVCLLMELHKVRQSNITRICKST